MIHKERFYESRTALFFMLYFKRYALANTFISAYTLPFLHGWANRHLLPIFPKYYLIH